MIYEIAGSRVLGPYLGTSTFVWTSLIGIILGSLSLGYWLGGRIADQKPSYTALAWIVTSSAFLIGLTTLIKEPFLHHLPRLIDGIKGQSVVASIFLFGPASVFLGMVSPYAVRLRIKTLQTSGQTVGKLYAISTVGSIAGTFAAGFFLIPFMGTSNILISITLLLALVSLILFIPEKKISYGLPALVIIAISVFLLISRSAKAYSYVDKDTQYNRVWIYNAVDQATGKPIKFMRINNESSSAMFLDSEEPVFDYMKYYRLAEHYCPGFKNALLLGGAAYSYPKYFLQRYPESNIDVVEIDPELTALAREHFRLNDDSRMRIIHEDARTYLNNSGEKYEVIFGDTFKSLYTLPWHLTTLEAAEKAYNMLEDKGCVVLNIISSLQGRSSYFLQAEIATYRQVFPYVYVFAVMDPDDLERVQSVILVAVKSDEEPAITSPDAVLDEYLKNEVISKINLKLPVLTDEYAPVDYYTDKGIK
jgi:spermidine synthase